MPFNVPSGRTVIFSAVFNDTSGGVIVASSATLTVTYPLSSNSLTLASCSITMTPASSYWTASWSSSVAALGMSSATATAPGQVTNAPGLAIELRITG